MKNMTEPTPHPRIIRNRKKRCIPLSNLRMSDAVKIVSDSPRRLEELLHMLEDPDRSIRNRAAATLSRLASLHPSRLLRSVDRMRESLLDESAYVRWHLVYTLGMMGTLFPARLQCAVPDIVGCLDDQNRIVRVMSSKSLAQIAVHNPRIVEELFQNVETEVPPIVADIPEKP